MKERKGFGLGLVWDRGAELVYGTGGVAGGAGLVLVCGMSGWEVEEDEGMDGWID